MIEYSWACSLNPEGIMLIIRPQKTVFTVIIPGLNTAEFANVYVCMLTLLCAWWLHETLHQISKFRPCQTRCYPLVRQKYVFLVSTLKLALRRCRGRGQLHIGRIGKPLSQHWTFRAFLLFFVSCGSSRPVTWQLLWSVPKCNDSTCRNIHASVRLIPPPKFWQWYEHIGTQMECFSANR